MNVIVPRSRSRSTDPRILEPGDQIATNDPYQGGDAPQRHCGVRADLSPRPDRRLCRQSRAPCRRGRLLCRKPRRQPARYTRRGIILPIVKIAPRGQLDTDVFKHVRCEHPREEGDGGRFPRPDRRQRHRRAPHRRADRALRASTSLDGFVEELFAYTAERTHRALRHLPEGVYEAEEFAGRRRASPTNRSASRSRSRFAKGACISISAAPTRSAPSSMNATLHPDLRRLRLRDRLPGRSRHPRNDGFFRLIEVTAPPGLVRQRAAPAGVAGGWEVSLRLCDLLFRPSRRRYRRRCPRAARRWCATRCSAGVTRATGKTTSSSRRSAGGHGGRSRSDGPDAVQTHHQNTQNTPIEEMEVFYPVRTLRYELRVEFRGRRRVSRRARRA